MGHFLGCGPRPTGGAQISGGGGVMFPKCVDFDCRCCRCFLLMAAVMKSVESSNVFRHDSAGPVQGARDHRLRRWRWQRRRFRPRPIVEPTLAHRTPFFFSNESDEMNRLEFPPILSLHGMRKIKMCCTKWSQQDMIFKRGKEGKKMSEA